MSRFLWFLGRLNIEWFNVDNNIINPHKITGNHTRQIFYSLDIKNIAQYSKTSEIRPILGLKKIGLIYGVVSL